MFRAALAFALLLAGGCATYITPPTDPADPVEVFLLADGRHTSLLLPDTAADSILEYSYGDWDWYALGKDQCYRAFPTLLWPTPGALGRRAFELEEVESEELRRIVVDEDALEGLRKRLDARYAGGIESLRHDPRYGLDFVQDEDSFWLFHTCNRAVGDWLRELDCRVQGPAMLSDFIVRPPPDRPGP